MGDNVPKPLWNICFASLKNYEFTTSSLISVSSYSAVADTLVFTVNISSGIDPVEPIGPILPDDGGTVAP